MGFRRALHKCSPVHIDEAGLFFTPVVAKHPYTHILVGTVNPMFSICFDIFRRGQARQHIRDDPLGVVLAVAKFLA